MRANTHSRAGSNDWDVATATRCRLSPWRRMHCVRCVGDGGQVKELTSWHAALVSSVECLAGCASEVSVRLYLEFGMFYLPVGVVCVTHGLGGTAVCGPLLL